MQNKSSNAIKRMELLNEIDSLWSIFSQVRAAYPYARKHHVGKTFVESSPYYVSRGLKYKLEFNRVLKDEDIIKMNELSHWVNQSSLIRLYALLEYHQIIAKNIKIDTSVEGHEELALLRLLRNTFSHTSKYNPKNKQQKKLYERIVKHFNVAQPLENFMPIPINEVIQKIFEKVKVYCEKVEPIKEIRVESCCE
jgi:hypothetical protein